MIHGNHIENCVKKCLGNWPAVYWWCPGRRGRHEGNSLILKCSLRRTGKKYREKKLLQLHRKQILQESVEGSGGEAARDCETHSKGHYVGV